ncbi:MAG TPA: hypothetical protein DIW31_04110 [Bacteroidales bacterium]|nr:hypothetical protein [Bacteroidales bacterium]
MEHICKNCGHNHTLIFCNQCGQKVIQHRFTTKQLFHDLFHNLIHIDKGFFYTFYSLLVRPHVVIMEYLNGATRKYTNPAQFAIYLVAIATFFLVKQGYIEKNSESFNSMIDINNQQSQDFTKSFMELIKNNLNYFTLLFLPFFALSSKWLFKVYNYAEHLIIHCYIYGLITILSLPIALYMDHYAVLKLINFVLVISIYSFSFYKLFNNKRFITVLKSIVFFILSYALFSAMLVLGTYIYLILKKMITGHAF